MYFYYHTIVTRVPAWSHKVCRASNITTAYMASMTARESPACCAWSHEVYEASNIAFTYMASCLQQRHWRPGYSIGDALKPQLNTLCINVIIAMYK